MLLLQQLTASKIALSDLNPLKEPGDAEHSEKNEDSKGEQSEVKSAPCDTKEKGNIFTVQSDYCWVTSAVTLFSSFWNSTTK